MRDLVLLMILAPGCFVALRYPFVGAMLWIWFSTMNPHRMAWGFMYDAPVAVLTGVCTLIGLLATKEKRSPLAGPPMAWMLVLTLWMCFTTAMAFFPSASMVQLEKVLKIYLMVFVAVMLVRSKREIMVMAWVLAFSIGFFGVKGGAFTLASGGDFRVYGPAGTFIQENNAMAVATITIVPLLRFLQTTLEKTWQKLAMTGAMLLCGASILGSHSRGALLAISAMLFVLWWRGKNKIATGALMIAAGLFTLSVMPEHWWSRMQSIQTFEEDKSAMGRINAWQMAYNIAKEHVTGGGFSIYRQSVYDQFAPDPSYVVSAHSIYFHMIGEHGFIGLFFYLCLGLAAWTSCNWLRRHGKRQKETEWCAQLGAMMQVSLVGFAAGGAFLSLTYYDLPYNLMVLVVATRVWVQSRAWLTEPAFEPNKRIFGIPLFFGDRLLRPSVAARQ